jgi:HD superfamily phosphohydrolase
MSNHKIIKDIVHGIIQVPDLCLKFINTEEFARLRRIKQLGLVEYVYPSATHNRYSHSIGVMHLAGKVVDLICQDNDVSCREKQLVQLAGLLHDVGHVAFSHLMDYILEEEKIHTEEITHHENRSIFILKKINSRLNVLSDEEIEKVKKMILGQYENQEKPYLYQIVNNKLYGFDVDKLDYLQRDLISTGMHCFDPGYLISCIKVKNNNLTLLKKAKHELEFMYEARKRLLMSLCRHKTVLKIEKIIRNAIKKCDLTGEWFEKNWLILTDYKIYSIFEEKCPEFLEDLNSRKLEDIDEEIRFKHISNVDRNDIENQINKIIWYDEII